MNISILLCYSNMKCKKDRDINCEKKDNKYLFIEILVKLEEFCKNLPLEPLKIPFQGKQL